MANIPDALKLHGSETVRDIIDEAAKSLPELNNIEFLPIVGETFQWARVTGNPTPQFRNSKTGIAAQGTDVESIEKVVKYLDSALCEDTKDTMKWHKGTADYLALQEKYAVQGFLTRLVELIYKGDSSVDPAEFDGILSDLKDVSGADERVVNAGGTTANAQTSIVFANYGDQGLNAVGHAENALSARGWRQETIYPDGGGSFEGYTNRMFGSFAVSRGHKKCIGAVRNVEASVIDKAFFESIELLLACLRTDNPNAKPNTVALNAKTEMVIRQKYRDTVTNSAVLPSLEEIWGVKVIITDGLSSDEDVLV